MSFLVPARLGDTDCLDVHIKVKEDDPDQQKPHVIVVLLQTNYVHSTFLLGSLRPLKPKIDREHSTFYSLETKNNSFFFNETRGTAMFL